MKRTVLIYGSSMAALIILLKIVEYRFFIFGDLAVEIFVGFIAFLFTAIAALFYAGGWEVYYNTAPNVRETFMARYEEMNVKKMRHEGATEETIAAKRAELQKMAEWYKNPFMRFGMTLVEIFPIGLVVALISAGILRKKNVLPA